MWEFAQELPNVDSIFTDSWTRTSRTLAQQDENLVKGYEANAHRQMKSLIGLGLIQLQQLLD
jgi:hypothetical protein